MTLLTIEKQSEKQRQYQFNTLKKKLALDNSKKASVSKKILPVEFRSLFETDANACLEIRHHIHQSNQHRGILENYGITTTSFARAIREKNVVGIACTYQKNVIAFTQGHRHSGEILSLNILPEYQNQGIGTKLLNGIMEQLRSYGVNDLWLGIPKNAHPRIFRFFHHLGWVSTGEVDEYGSDILEISLSE